MVDRDGRFTPVTIVACRDGPFLVRGEAELVGPDGAPLARRRRTVGLCRCGVSSIKPYCDGSHKAAGFRSAEPGDETPGSGDANRTQEA